MTIQGKKTGEMFPKTSDNYFDKVFQAAENMSKKKQDFVLATSDKKVWKAYKAMVENKSSDYFLEPDEKVKLLNIHKK
jgi:hypothetical protein